MLYDWFYSSIFKSYYLKTTLFFLTKETTQKEQSRLHWAIKIYRQLRTFLKRDGRIPHFFLNHENRADGECLFNCDDEPRHIKAQQHTNMLSAVKTCISFLQQQVLCHIFFLLTWLRKIDIRIAYFRGIDFVLFELCISLSVKYRVFFDSF